MPHDLPRIVMAASLASLPDVGSLAFRSPSASDKPALARLMYDAYVDTIDYEGEDEARCLAEIEKTFSGEYGAFNQPCSRIVDVAGVATSAALLTRWQERPFVAFSITAKAFAGRGLARACLVSAMHALREQGESEVRLVVTLANLRALRLYQGLGFQVENAD